MSILPGKIRFSLAPRLAASVCVALAALAGSFNIFSETPSARPNRPVIPAHRPTSPVVSTELPDSFPVNYADPLPDFVTLDSISAAGDSLAIVPIDTVMVVRPEQAPARIPEQAFTFNPDPTRAVWMSALCPGLGQLYNRRYWKLPLIVGGYLGLGYATSWNNQMLKDYTRAYSDLLDNDPSSNSYMDFFAPNVNEADLDKAWLQNLLRSRKNYFRRNRDLCIISMVGVYLLAMVDAYVDASLSHFDITPRLSMDVAPAIMQDGRQRYPSVGLAWALNF